MTRRTAGRLIGVGGFLFMTAVFLAPLRFGWPVAVVVVIALVMGVSFGAGLRAVVQSGWPRMPEALRDLDSEPDAGMDVLRPPVAQQDVRRTYRPDVDDTVVTSVPEVFGDLTITIPGPKGYRGARRADAR